MQYFFPRKLFSKFQKVYSLCIFDTVTDVTPTVIPEYLPGYRLSDLLKPLIFFIFKASLGIFDNVIHLCLITGNKESDQKIKSK